MTQKPKGMAIYTLEIEDEQAAKTFIGAFNSLLARHSGRVELVKAEFRQAGDHRYPAAYVHPSAHLEEDVEIGAGSRVWHFSHIMKGARIGKGCTLGQNVFIGEGVIIGDGCRIQNNVSVYQGVHLERNVFVGPSAVFTNVKNPRAQVVAGKGNFEETHVLEGATIGANATVVCGNSIGRFAFVGAGSVVTKPVPSHVMVVGNPALSVGSVNAEGILQFKYDGKGAL